MADEARRVHEEEGDDEGEGEDEDGGRARLLSAGDAATKHESVNVAAAQASSRMLRSAPTLTPGASQFLRPMPLVSTVDIQNPSLVLHNPWYFEEEPADDLEAEAMAEGTVEELAEEGGDMRDEEIKLQEI